MKAVQRIDFNWDTLSRPTPITNRDQVFIQIAADLFWEKPAWTHPNQFNYPAADATEGVISSI